MKAYTLLVFDWDGTLMDSEARIVACLQQAISDLGLELRSPQALSNIIGLGMRESILSLYPDADDDQVAAFFEHYRQHFLSDQALPSALFPGALEMLQGLQQQGYLLAVATGKSRRGLNRSLDETGTDSLFQVSRCADETFSKPHPQMLLEIMAVLDVNPKETLMIGDTEYDMLMARQAGTAALAVDYGVHERQRLLELQPLACLSNIRELSAWLGNEPQRNGLEIKDREKNGQ